MSNIWWGTGFPLKLAECYWVKWKQLALWFESLEKNKTERGITDEETIFVGRNKGKDV